MQFLQFLIAFTLKTVGIVAFDHSINSSSIVAWLEFLTEMTSFKCWWNRCRTFLLVGSWLRAIQDTLSYKLCLVDAINTTISYRPAKALRSTSVFNLKITRLSREIQSLKDVFYWYNTKPLLSPTPIRYSTIWYDCSVFRNLGLKSWYQHLYFWVIWKIYNISNFTFFIFFSTWQE